jgi:SAM-dependent methyltransferase
LITMPDDTLLESPTRHPGEVYPVSHNDVYQSVNQQLVAALDVADDAAVIDLGCGDGMLSRLLLERHGDTLRIWAVDPDEAMLAGARTALGGRVGVCAGSAETFADMFPPASCDAVVLANSLHLVANRPALYQGVHRVLRSGGLFGFNTSFYENAHTASNGTFGLSVYLEARGLAKRRGVDIPPADPRLARTLPTTPSLIDELGAASFEVAHADERSVVMDVELLQSFVSSPYFAATVFPALDQSIGGALLGDAVPLVAAKRSKPVERSWLTVVARRAEQERPT